MAMASMASIPFHSLLTPREQELVTRLQNIKATHSGSILVRQVSTSSISSELYQVDAREPGRKGEGNPKASILGCKGRLVLYCAHALMLYVFF